MENRLNASKNKIYKLKVIKVLKSGLIVKQLNGLEGFIHISEVSDKYIKDLTEIFTEEQYVYAKLITKEKRKFFFSMKQGHTIPLDIQKKYRVSETGGGYLGIKYNLNKFIKSK